MTKSKLAQYAIKSECFELWRESGPCFGGKDGPGSERIEIARRPLDLLCYLLEHRDRVVSREELVAEVWAGLAISPGAVDTAIYEVRQALGENARSKAERWVQTVRGRGFRLSEEAAIRIDRAPHLFAVDGFAERRIPSGFRIPNSAPPRAASA